MQSPFFKDISLAVCGFLIALGIHSWNGALADLPGMVHTTADDPSYLRPAENWTNNDTWKDNSIGVSSWIQRPPGMGIIHLPFYLLFGNHAVSAEIWLFFLLHGVALYLLPGIFRRFLPEKPSFILCWIYALLPCFWGFLSYTITEAVTPSLIILAIAALLHTGRFSLGASIFLLFAIWMIRPLLILLFPLLIWRLWKDRSLLFSRKQPWNALILCSCLFLAGSWEVRKSRLLANEGYALHPIYSITNESQYRPLHAAFSDLFRIWETKPERFHALMGRCWTTTSPVIRLSDIENYCQEAHAPIDPVMLKSKLERYSAVNKLLLQQLENEKIKAEIPEERNLRAQINAFTKELRHKHPLQAHLITPLRSAADQFQKSQLNLELFQRYYRGTWWVEILRYACVLLILLVTLGTLLSLFSGQIMLRWLTVGCCCYFFYLFYVQRLNEDRYMLPALPMLFITGSCYWFLFIDRIRKGIHQKSEAGVSGFC